MVGKLTEVKLYPFFNNRDWKLCIYLTKSYLGRHFLSFVGTNTHVFNYKNVNNQNCW